jgi:hypothetical protein
LQRTDEQHCSQNTQKIFKYRELVQARFIRMRVNWSAQDFADEQFTDQLQIKKKQEINLRQVLVRALAIAGLFALVGAQPAFADCRSENVSCVKGANSPFDSVACGSLYRTCAAHKALAAQHQVKQLHNTSRPATLPSAGTHSGRR